MTSTSLPPSALPPETRRGEASAPHDPAATVARLRATYASGRTRDLAWRTEQLTALGRMLVDHEAAFLAALASDVGKPTYEGWAGDLRATGREIEHLTRHLPAWAAPERQRTPLIIKPATASVVREPLGTVLVIAPWNYPVHLLVSPLAAALAAGNTVVCKPSEVAPATSAALARLIPLYLDPEAVAVVEGGVAETTALLEQRWDHIFYTGNGVVGRIVAEAAARHLTPVTLELGGKSPVIVDRGANLRLAAQRVAFARFSNAGQTCVAADHVWVHRDDEAAFLDALTDELTSRYGREPRESPDLARIVNSRHASRVKSLLDAGGYELVCGGEVDTEARYVAPTVVRAVAPDSPLLREEIFGPVLPVLTYTDLAEPIAAVNAGEKPLALYVFTADDAVAERVVAETSSGGVCVNDTMSNLFVPGLPFGGVGGSGYGAYHGRWGFETFSHRKAVLRKPSQARELPAMRAPYKPWKLWLMRRFL